MVGMGSEYRSRFWTQTFRVILLGALLAGMAGCSGDRGAWVGEWRGEQPLLFQGGQPTDSPIANTLRSVRVTIKTDGRFEMLKGGMAYSGFATLTGGKATLRVTELLGQPIERAVAGGQPFTITMERREDGRILLVDPGDFGRDPVEMKPFSAP